MDRADYLGDPDYNNIPVAELTAKKYAEVWRAGIDATPPSPSAKLVRPAGFLPQAPATAGSRRAESQDTTHYSVVDSEGNAVAVTTTLNDSFGSHVTSGSLGILLNDEMDDFAVAPGVPNAFKIVGEKNNEVAPGKRPLSSMSPIIALENGRPALVAGGSGGPTIISGVTQVTLNLLDFRLQPGAAIAEPRIHEQAQPDLVLVEESVPVKTKGQMTAMGYRLKVVPELGAVSAIRIKPGALRGAFDQRKGGGAVGD